MFEVPFTLWLCNFCFKLYCIILSLKTKNKKNKNKNKNKNKKTKQKKIKIKIKQNKKSLYWFFKNAAIAP